MAEDKQTNWLDAFVIRMSHIAMWMSVAIVAIIFYEVVARYVFNRPTLWAYELSWWLAGALYLFAGMYVMQQRAHIRLTLFYDVFPPWLRRVCDVVTCVVICTFCFAVLWGGLDDAVAKLTRWEKLGSAWSPPIPATLKPLIIVTVCVLALQSISNLIFDWRAQGKAADDDDDAPAQDDAARGQ